MLHVAAEKFRTDKKHKWELIALEFTDRSPEHCRRRYFQLQLQKKRQLEKFVNSFEILGSGYSDIV